MIIIWTVCKYICIFYAPLPLVLPSALRPCRIVEATRVRATPHPFLLSPKRHVRYYYVCSYDWGSVFEGTGLPSKAAPPMRLDDHPLYSLYTSTPRAQKFPLLFWLPTFFHGPLFI
jgi:hypothetical protein